MQEETSRKIIREIRKALNGIRVDFVMHRESWSIVHEEGQRPRLEKSRYFSFVDRERPWPSDRADIICMTEEEERAVQAYIRDALGLRPFAPGEADPSSLLEVWA